MIFTFSVTEVSPAEPPVQRIFTDIALDTDGDLDISTQDLSLLSDKNAVIQDIAIRLQFFKGEWFLNQDEGIPYWQEILKKNPRTNVLRTIFTNAILTTPLMTEVNNLVIELDAATRGLSVSFDGIAVIDGSEVAIDFDKTFLVGDT